MLQESINTEYVSTKYCEIWLVHWCIYMKQLERDAVLGAETKAKGKVTLWTVLLLIAFSLRGQSCKNEGKKMD